MHVPFLTVAVALSSLVGTSFAEEPAAGDDAAAAQPPVEQAEPAKPKREVAKDIVLTDEELKQYNGEDESKPIYLAINGIIYDVSDQPQFYGPKGAYGHFTGRDATRSWVTECWDTPDQLTWRMDGVEEMYTPRWLDEEVEKFNNGEEPDLIVGEFELTQFLPQLQKALKKIGNPPADLKRTRRMLDKEEALAAVQERVTHWANFFNTSHRYPTVGTVAPREPGSGEDPPPPCDAALKKRPLKGGLLDKVDLPSGPVKTAAKTQKAQSTGKEEL